MKRKAIALPSAIIPFILRGLDGFDICLEDGDRIIITPKAEALPSAALTSHLQSALPQTHPRSTLPQRRTAELPTARHTGIPVMRHKFIYIVTNVNRTPTFAKAKGMSKPRLRVYEIIHASGAEGVGNKVIRDKSGLPHGSVQQILHWLRKQQWITGEPLMGN